MAWPGNNRLNTRKFVRALRRASSAVQEVWTHPDRFALDVPRAGVSEVLDFGYNPGRLRMNIYVPSPAPSADAALIVALHGCGQKAVDFARDAGLIDLADRLHVPLVLPQQSEENNCQGCYNWFRPSDIARGRGEVLSIRQMASEAARRFRSDPRRIFVVGLSAGGAMAAALLGAYPDVFAAGAVVAGLPVGAARTPVQAVEQMSRPAVRAPQEWAMQVRSIGPARHRGKWPRLSIWQGGEDRTVAPANAENLAAQWVALHGLAHQPAAVTTPAAGVTHRVWGSPRHPEVELWMVEAMGHAFPVAAQGGTDAAEPGGAEILFGPWGFGTFGPAFPFAGSRERRFVHPGMDAANAIAHFFRLA